MNKYHGEEPFDYSTDPKSSDNEFFGSGWSVKRDGTKYYFCYISGQLQGACQKVEITALDFEDIKKGNMSFNEICRKYQVH